MVVERSNSTLVFTAPPTDLDSGSQCEAVLELVASSNSRTVTDLPLRPARPRTRRSHRGLPRSHPMTLRSMSWGPEALVSQVDVSEPSYVLFTGCTLSPVARGYGS